MSNIQLMLIATLNQLLNHISVGNFTTDMLMTVIATGSSLNDQNK